MGPGIFAHNVQNIIQAAATAIFHLEYAALQVFESEVIQCE